MTRRGATTAELVVTLLLLLLVGFLTFTVANAGGEAYRRLSLRTARDGELRIAASYLDVRFRKHDAEGVLRLEPAPTGTGRALVFSEAVDGLVVETWIYCAEGRLWELQLLPELGVEPAAATPIAAVDRLFVTVLSDGRFLLGLNLKADGDSPALSQTLTFRPRTEVMAP